MVTVKDQLQTDRVLFHTSAASLNTRAGSDLYNGHGPVPCPAVRAVLHPALKSANIPFFARLI